MVDSTSHDDSRPILVLIPGAWHSPCHFAELTAMLGARGYTAISDRNLSTGSRNPEEESVSGDAAAIRENLLLPYIDAGKEVVLVMHSYGGIPGGLSAAGLSKPELSQQGKPGGVIGLAFMCSFTLPQAKSVKSFLPNGEYETWHILTDDGQVLIEDPKGLFYHDVPGPEDEIAIRTLRYQSRASFESEIPSPPWLLPVFNGRRSYLFATEDRAIVYPGQKAMIAATGVEWHTEEIKTSHSPFLVQPKETADWIVRQVEYFKSAG